jgi:hypothetical protein
MRLMDGETDVAIDRCSRDMKGTDERSDENESEGARGRAGKRYRCGQLSRIIYVRRSIKDSQRMSSWVAYWKRGLTSATKSLRR